MILCPADTVTSRTVFSYAVFFLCLKVEMNLTRATDLIDENILLILFVPEIIMLYVLVSKHLFGTSVHDTLET